MKLRTPPKCTQCGEPIPAKYIDMRILDPNNFWIGDSFSHWDWDRHIREDCKFKKREKDIDKILDKENGNTETPE